MFINIEKEIKKDFENEIIKILSTPAKRMYYYWDLEYFSRVDGIKFEYYDLSREQKQFINLYKVDYFNDKNIKFYINPNSHRHDITIKNIKLLFDGFSGTPQIHFEYLKEYILWKIIHVEFGTHFDENIVSTQKINFIYTYLNYLTNNHKGHCFDQYTPFLTTKQGKELGSYLTELQKGYSLEMYKTESNELFNRISSLRVLSKKSSKISFVFDIPATPGKDELRFVLEKLSNNKEELLFRGQANSNWVLDSSITRKKKLLKSENYLFQKILSLRPNEFHNDVSDYEKLITMQHYGLPTRLLDVTRNPLISVFFASNNLDEKDQDGLVYIFENKDMIEPDDPKVYCLMKIIKTQEINICDTCDDNVENCHYHKGNKLINLAEKKSKKHFLKDNWLIRGVAKNQRITNQSGDFIFVGLGENSRKNEQLKSLPSRYLVIDHKVKKNLLEYLEVMNIHGGTVYPDLSNMSNYLKNKEIYK